MVFMLYSSGIGGSVDFVGGLADGTFCLMDWKRAKNLADKGSKSFGRRGKYILIIELY